VPARYELWHTTAAHLAERVAGLRAANVLGANVTVPHKLAVMAWLDEVAPTARQAGAVNTIINEQGRLRGENTDIHGFAAALREIDAAAPSRRALILGAGGAARAVVLALTGVGVTEIVIANRDPTRAARLASDLASVPVRLVGVDVATLRVEMQSATLLVNATSLGWHAGETPLPLDLLSLAPAELAVVDLTYRETDLLRAARGRGVLTADGLSMLVHQGARALELWTGRSAPLAVMMAAARAARAAREGLA
jgi:shikimate dehydrogenase